MTDVQAPQAQPVPVEFVVARSDASMRAGVRMRAWLFLGLAAWCVAAAVVVHPLAGALAAVVWLELSGSALCVAAVSRGTSSDPVIVSRVAPAVREVCGRAGCAVPRVMLRKDSLRGAGVRPAKPRPLLILSVPFVERIDDSQLRALVAHEIAHVVGGDLEVMRRRRIAVTLVAVVGSFLWGLLSKDPFAGPIWGAALSAALIALVWVAAPRNRVREVRADELGARLSGDPLALAAALRVASALSEETRRRAFGSPAVRMLLAPVIWRPRTHPPLDQRIARLEALAARQGAA